MNKKQLLDIITSELSKIGLKKKVIIGLIMGM